MATAKQIAWRKEFVKRVKAGTLTKKRKPAVKRASNPAKKRRPAVKRARKAINAPSQITKRKPTARLKARRSSNVKPGYFPNPSERSSYYVQTLRDETLASFHGKSAKTRALEYAQALARKTGRQYQVKGQ